MKTKAPSTSDDNSCRTGMKIPANRLGSGLWQTKTARLVTAPFFIFNQTSFLRTFEDVLIDEICSGRIFGPASIAYQFPTALAIFIQHSFALGTVGGAGAILPLGGGRGTTGKNSDDDKQRSKISDRVFHIVKHWLFLAGTFEH